MCGSCFQVVVSKEIQVKNHSKGGKNNLKPRKGCLRVGNWLKLPTVSKLVPETVGDKMNLLKRREAIVALLSKNGFTKVADIANEFGVSSETIRKDLLALETDKTVVRAHGGVQLVSEKSESMYDRRRALNTEQKRFIGELALGLINDHETVFLDYGTTTYALAERLVDSELEITVVTNTLPIAMLLSEHPTIQLIVLGGMLRKNENSLYGPQAEKAISELFFNIGFFGCAGVSSLAGVTNFHPLEVATSRVAFEHCERKALLVDRTKFEEFASHKMADISEFSYMVSDMEPGPELRQILKSGHTELITKGGSVQ